MVISSFPRSGKKKGPTTPPFFFFFLPPSLPFLSLYDMKRGEQTRNPFLPPLFPPGFERARWNGSPAFLFPLFLASPFPPRRKDEKALLPSFFPLPPLPVSFDLLGKGERKSIVFPSPPSSFRSGEANRVVFFFFPPPPPLVFSPLSQRVARIYPSPFLSFFSPLFFCFFFFC